MFSLESGYFVGCLILTIPYILIFLLRKDLRKEMILGSVLLSPFALLAPFYIPEYWNPPYLFGLLPLINVGIEDFIFCFVVGGLSSLIFEFIFWKKEIKLRRKRKLLWTPYILTISLLLAGEFLFPDKSILIIAVTGFIVASYIDIKRKDLVIQSLASGILFTLLYFTLFKVFKYIYPSYIELIYQHENLLGTYVYGIPLEELLFAFATGAAWSIMYEYIFGYKTSKKVTPKKPYL